MICAFLFLIYETIFNSDYVLKFIKNNNIYIHPKFPDKIDSHLKKYIINDLVKTEWGKYSIVNATLNLLKEAYKKKDNTYFILLSGDSYPVVTYEDFINKFNKNKSSFYFIEKIDIYYKSSQWWILTRDDVKIILDNESKYYKLFKNLHLDAAIDELYFLSVLHFENSSYQYNNIQIIYTKWNKYVWSYHPLIFNKITDIDLIEIDKSKSFFIRKVLNNFKLNPIKYKKILYIITIGSLTNQENINYFLNLHQHYIDVIIFSLIDFNKLYINLNNVLYIHIIHHTLLYHNILELCINSKKLLKKYNDGIFIVTEKFNMIDTIISNKIMNISKSKLYYTLKDKNNNEAYYTLIFSPKFINKIIENNI